MCSRKLSKTTFQKQRIKLNNVLIEYAHLLFDAVTFGPPPGTMLLPRAFSRFVGDRSFNVSAATASWACVGGVGGEAPPSAGLTVRTSFAHGEQRQFSDVVTRNASEVYRGALSGGRSAALLAFERVAIAQVSCLSRKGVVGWLVGWLVIIWREGVIE